MATRSTCRIRDVHVGASGRLTPDPRGPHVDVSIGLPRELGLVPDVGAGVGRDTTLARRSSWLMIGLGEAVLQFLVHGSSIAYRVYQPSGPCPRSA